MAHAASSADNHALLHANACSPVSDVPSRSSSPKFNIADFEHRIQLPRSALTAANTSRETSYASQANIDDLDFARSASNTPPRVDGRYSRGLNSSFLKRSASKLLPRGIATSNLVPASQPSSGASSPTKSLSSFITGTSSASNTISSSASKASVRARTASRAIFDNYFNGDSNKLHIGVLPPAHSRTTSVASLSFPPPPARTENNSHEEDGYEPDCELNMNTQSYTRAPSRTRPRRSPTADSTSSTTYAGKIGSWWNSTKQSSPKPSSQSPAATTFTPQESADDPLLSLSIECSLFPHGPVDPLNPTSFNDLLSAAEALLSTYRNAYARRVSEIATLKAETALKQDELEEAETRNRHLKMQLTDLGEQCNAEKEKASLLEGLVREEEVETREAVCRACDCRGVEQRTHSRGSDSRAGTDSGFESDGDSVFSAHMDQQHEALRTKNHPASSTPGMPANVAPQLYAGNGGDLRYENEMLRARVAELEGAVEGCLDMLSNPLTL